MKHLQNVWWFLGFAFSYAVFFLSAERLLSVIMPLLDISPNRATAGAYSAELVVLFSCATALIIRVVTAVTTATSIKRAIKIILSKTALASLAVVGTVVVQIQNRGQWWLKHMFTDLAYSHPVYTATTSSLMSGTFLIALIFAAYPRKLPGTTMSFSDFGSDRLSLAILIASIIAFFLGASFYSGKA